MRMIRMLAAGVAAGAAVMYLADPDRGHARRAALRDRTMRVARRGWRWTRNATLDTFNHASGLLAEARARTTCERAPDAVLVERVRSEMGHVIDHSHRVQVTADAGWIQLRGTVLPNEKQALVAAVRNVPGVFGIEDHLDEHVWLEELVDSERPEPA
ncbi:MAG TPA: BON domain-containing protein [Chloroflexota bacterium]